jgi:hypothetical protein
MVSAAPVCLHRARRIASLAHVVAVVACVLIVVMIVAQSAIPAFTAYFSGEGGSASRLKSALTALIPALPLVFFFFSLFRLRQALDHYSDGEFFSPKPGRHIAGAGVSAVLALAAAIVAPALQAWTAGTRFPFEIEPVMAAMLAFALFVMIVGRILEAAAAIKAENDEIV